MLCPQGHLGIFETTEELDALKELIKAAPKWARSAEFAIGAKTEGGRNSCFVILIVESQINYS